MSLLVTICGRDLLQDCNRSTYDDRSLTRQHVVPSCFRLAPGKSFIPGGRCIRLCVAPTLQASPATCQEAQIARMRVRAPGPLLVQFICTQAPASPPPLTLQPTRFSAERLADERGVFVVSGGSRGLGLQFCRSLLEGSKGSVIALSRVPHRSDGLRAVGEDFPGRLRTISVDLTSEESIRQAATAAASMCDHVDILVNCAGILHDNSFMPERSLAACNAEWMHRVYALNAVAPVLLTAAFVPLLSGTPTSRPRIVANLSARVGSVSDNRLGGWWSYRMSKAALNMATRNMAIELKRKRVLALALHPGTSDTGLSKPFQKNVKPEKLFTTEFAVESMLKIIHSAEDEHSGHLFAWDGQLIPF